MQCSLQGDAKHRTLVNCIQSMATDALFRCRAVYNITKEIIMQQECIRSGEAA